MTALRPCGVIICTKCVDLLLALFAFTASCLASGDAERRKFLCCNELISHHVGTTNLKPALEGIIFSGNQLDHKLRFPSCWTIAGLALIQIIAHDTMLHLSHSGIVERTGGIVADAGFETLRGGEIHILRISYGSTVYQEIIGKCLVDMLVDLNAPDAVAVAFHRQRLGQNLCSQRDLFGLRGLHAEDDAVILVFGRDDGLGEETCHHTRRELLFLTSGSRCGLCVFHSLFCSFGVEEQR